MIHICRIHIYIYNTFICKLECKKFTIKPKEIILEEIWNKIVLKEIDTSEYKSEFNTIFNEIKENTNIIWKYSRINNIRILHKTLYNYVDFTMNLLKKIMNLLKKQRKNWSFLY